MTNRPPAFLPVFFIAAAGAVALVLSCVVCHAGEAKEAGMELLYENADTVSRADASRQVNLEKVVAILNRRFTGQLAKTLHAELGSPSQIRIRIAGTDPDTVREVESRAEAIGTVEFRVLANRNDNESVIREAQSDRSREVWGKNGRLIAEWVPVDESAEAALTAAKDAVTRFDSIRGRRVLWVLVVHDVYNVNGEYLERVEVGVDRLNRPCLVLHWNRIGKDLLGGLTGANLPDRERGITRRLGIVLEYWLYGAIPIETKLSNTVEITGSFRRQDLDTLSAILNGGSLPSRLRQVAKRAVTTETR